jgi:hypothetical protein
MFDSENVPDPPTIVQARHQLKIANFHLRRTIVSSIKRSKCCKVKIERKAPPPPLREVGI